MVEAVHASGGGGGVMRCLLAPLGGSRPATLLQWSNLSPAGPIASELLAVNFIAALALQVASISSSSSSDKSKSGPSRWIKHLDPNLMAFVGAFVLANTTPLLSKSSELLETLGWKYFLQGALALSLAANYDSSSTIGKYDALPILAAFLMGCTGSLLGGVLAYRCVSTLMAARSTEMAICASSLMASYIGGTANFFETSVSLALAYSPARKISILGVVAAIDIAFMVIFFQLLTYIRNRYADDRADGPTTLPAPRYRLEAADERVTTMSLEERALYQCLPIASAFALCKLSTIVQSLLKINGISVTITTGLSLLAAAALGRSGMRQQLPRLLCAMSDSSSFLVALFYASIGLLLSARDIQAAGAPIVALISIILLTHITTALLLRSVWNRLLPMKYHIDIETLAVASNACVGGAGTASQMASSFNRPDLCVMGSLVGVLGYCVGTQAAIKVSKKLMF